MRPWLSKFVPRCTHKKTSLPITRRRTDIEINRLANTYVVCLNCDEKIPYSFSEDKAVHERRKSEVEPTQQVPSAGFARDSGSV